MAECKRPADVGPGNHSISHDVYLRDQATVDHWQEAIKAAYALAYAERSAELRMKRMARFDGRGLHPFSYEIGRVEVLQNQLPWLDPELLVDARELKRQAELDATRDWLASADRSPFAEVERA